MTFQKGIQMKSKRGFTLIELLVVVAIISILLAIVVPALGKAKELVKKAICKNNVRQQCLGTILYSENNEGWVPTVPTGNWFWDVSFWSTNEIGRESGIDYKSFFCPVNRIKSPEDARYWQFSWVYTWGVDLHSPQQRRDESVLTLAQQKAHFRVLPFIYMFERLDPVTKVSRLPDKLETGEKPNWISKISGLKNASAAIMIMDAVISQNGAEADSNFAFITAGGSMADFGIPDATNHLTKRTYPGKPSNYFIPEGANIGFADGHVEARPFDQMKRRLTWGQVFWW